MKDDKTKKRMANIKKVEPKKASVSAAPMKPAEKRLAKGKRVEYETKGGTRTKTEVQFRGAQAKEKTARELGDKKLYRTADGKTHPTMDAYKAHKAKLKADPKSKYYK